MMITLAIFVMLAAAVFGIMSGVLQSTSALQDNQNRRDQIDALNAYIKKQLREMPAAGQLATYRRGDGEGLVENGIVFGTANLATALDAKLQPNGYYTLRLATDNSASVQGVVSDARQTLSQRAATDDATLAWTPLITDIKAIGWKFQDLNATEWVDLWNSPNKPNLVEFTVQQAGDLRGTTMDFWLPKIEPIALTPAVPSTHDP
jgi:type II secretory pathway component PulJ